MKKKFSDFSKRKDFVSTFHIKIEEDELTPGAAVAGFSPSDGLKHALERAHVIPLRTEQAIREALIFPVLMEIAWHFKDRISLFSGVDWGEETEDSTETEGIILGGICDYIIRGKPKMDVLATPAICVVEAKRENFEAGTWQCGAELVAIKIANEKAGNPYPFYFGALSTGTLWKFIKLDCEKNILTRDSIYYSIDALQRLLGVWKWVLETQLASAPDFQSNAKNL